MNNFFTEFKNKARAIKLSQNEKQHMRIRLYTYFEQNPAGAFTPAPVRQVARLSPSPYFFFSPRFAVPVVLLLIAGLGSGTAFAAQGALPGDALYAVKINVNEKVAVALATTPQAKAEVNASLATTRLEEAETLAATNKLDATTTAELASNLELHVKAAQSSAASLEANDPGTAAQLGASLDSTLAAHGAVLAQIGDDSSSTETMQSSNVLAAQVVAQQQSGDPVLALAPQAPAVVVAMDAPADTGSSTDTGGTQVRTFAAKASLKVVAPSTGQPAEQVTVSVDAASSSADTVTVTTAKPTPVPAPTARDVQIATSLAAQASTTLAQLLEDSAHISTMLDASSSAQIQLQLQHIQTLYDSATLQLNATDAASAKYTFGRVLRMSIKLDTYLQAGQKFNVGLLSNLLHL